MENKKFEVEVAEIKSQVDKHAEASERLKVLLETETELAVKFSEGLRLLRSYVSAGSVAKMIGLYKNYKSDGYSDDEAITAVMWKEVEWTSTPSSKVEAAIEKLLAYDPSRKAARIRFKNNHKFLVIAGYVLWCVMIFVGTQFWVAEITSDSFTRYFAPSIITVLYVVFTVNFLKKKNY